EIYESIIRSNERLIYDDISDIIETGDETLKQKYSKIYEDIMMMAELANILWFKREARGNLDFDFDEARITLNDEGIPSSVDISERRTANRMIEEFMLSANETVAKHFNLINIPFVYRVHESPDEEKLEELRTFLQSFSINLAQQGNKIHPRLLADILKSIKGLPYENVISAVMLRSMKKASYEVECSGHFGLALKYYCHFTSPIRRYPDLIIHRIIKENLRSGKFGNKRISELKKITEEAAELSSINERRALELERDAEKMKKAEYMSYHIGEVYEGVISGVTNYGIYVQLPNTIEGMVRLDSISDDYYDYEQNKYRIIGRRTNNIYSLGQPVSIKVMRASAIEREIDFELI
ncbi:MAG: RNB domain-containing ribonuclease, partial [Eubacteriales bacterium]|nr:RNB domain-containing ribonuclease [Eubacteriales bacterium]